MDDLRVNVSNSARGMYVGATFYNARGHKISDASAREMPNNIGLYFAAFNVPSGATKATVALWRKQISDCSVARTRWEKRACSENGYFMRGELDRRTINLRRR